MHRDQHPGLGKVVPYVGYFVALAATTFLSVVLVRRAHAAPLGRTVLGSVVATAFTALFMFGASRLARG